MLFVDSFSLSYFYCHIWFRAVFWQIFSVEKEKKNWNNFNNRYAYANKYFTGHPNRIKIHIVNIQTLISGHVRFMRLLYTENCNKCVCHLKWAGKKGLFLHPCQTETNHICLTVLTQQSGSFDVMINSFTDSFFDFFLSFTLDSQLTIFVADHYVPDFLCVCVCVCLLSLWPWA